MAAHWRFDPHRALLVATCSGAALAAGCRHLPPTPATPAPEGRTSYQRVAEPAGTARYVLHAGQSAIQPALQRNPDPVYPAAWLPRDLPPVSIVARLSVDADGRVTAVFVPPSPTPPAWRAAFETAVRDCALAWHFSPLRIRTVTDDGITPPSVRIDSKPFSAWFRFHFAVVSGEPRTGSAAARGTGA